MNRGSMTEEVRLTVEHFRRQRWGRERLPGNLGTESWRMSLLKNRRDFPGSLVVKTPLQGSQVRFPGWGNKIPHAAVQFIHSVVSDSLCPHGLQHARLPCPSPTPGAYLMSYPLSRWCHPTISSSVVPFSSRLHTAVCVCMCVWAGKQEEKWDSHNQKKFASFSKA